MTDVGIQTDDILINGIPLQEFLDNIPINNKSLWASIDKNSFHYHESIHEDIFNSNEDTQRFRYKFYIKNVHDSPLRKESRVDDDIVDVRIEYKNNIYYYDVGIYKLKMKNMEENNCTPEKMRKDIYHKGPLTDNYFWDFLEFSYEVQ